MSFWGVSGESEDEEDDLDFSAGGVSTGVYVQRVLRLMKSLHAQVQLLLCASPLKCGFWSDIWWCRASSKNDSLLPEVYFWEAWTQC